jgi:plastocyanin
MSAGVLKGAPIEQAASAGMAHGATGALRFAQISDSHIGFDKAANADVIGTLRDAVAKIKAASDPPAFVLHTGDLTHLSKPAEFDTLQQVLSELSVPIFYVPGEHDVLEDDGKSFLERFGQGTTGDGWHSFDHSGVHFVALVNVVNLKAGGLGNLGDEQLEWLERDLKRVSSSTPVVVFAHIPLWSVYPDWGWGTDDSARALSSLRRFGSVSVLNGHIHQVMQKVEGHITFHTAMSTAFPQPAPGAAPSPGPMTVEAARLKQLLGLSRMSFHNLHSPIAITDMTLDEGAAATQGGRDVRIDNFAFTPATVRVSAGATINWVNRDDVPHRLVAVDHTFTSPVLDTDGSYSCTFNSQGTHEYFCSLHPKMTGTITVE